MAWTTSENQLLGQAISDLSTTKKHTLGKIVRAKDDTYGEGEFIYLAGVASCVAKSWVTYEDDAYTTTLLAAGAKGPVAVAMAACTSSYYGWFQINGKALAKCLTLYASGNRAWITATGGSVDDASVAGDGIQRVKGASTATVGDLFAEFSIERPWVDAFTSFS